jgi:hypothetical protein
MQNFGVFYVLGGINEIFCASKVNKISSMIKYIFWQISEHLLDVVQEQCIFKYFNAQNLLGFN